MPSCSFATWELLSESFCVSNWLNSGLSLGVLILFKASEKEPLLMVRIKMVNKYTDEVKGCNV